VWAAPRLELHGSTPLHYQWRCFGDEALRSMVPVVRMERTMWWQARCWPLCAISSRCVYMSFVWTLMLGAGASRSVARSIQPLC
jgi:hypothetical protein